MAKRKPNVFTDEEKKELQSAASAVWDEVAYDCLVATAEEKGKTVDEVTIRRSVVIEISLDAGRPEEHLRRALNALNKRTPFTDEDGARARVLTGLIEKLNSSYDKKAYTYGQLIAAVRPAFPYTHYGT